MAQALSKANFALPAGCFQMDGSDGELWFRSSMPICDGNPTDDQLRSLMLAAWNTTGRYTTALVEVAFTEIEIPFFCNVSDDLLQRFDSLIGLLFLLFSACSKTRGLVLTRRNASKLAHGKPTAATPLNCASSQFLATRCCGSLMIRA